MTRYECEDVLRRLDAYLDRELSEKEMQLVRQHVESCVTCAREVGFEGRVLDELKKKMRRVEMPAELSERIGRLLSDPAAEDN